MSSNSFSLFVFQNIMFCTILSTYAALLYCCVLSVNDDDDDDDDDTAAAADDDLTVCIYV